jgi:hypothetical protein
MATPTYTPIASYTLGSPATSVTFGSGNTLPQTYTDLVIVIQGIQDSSYSARNMAIRFNGDTGSNYSSVQVLNASSGADANLGSAYGPLINSSTNTTSGAFANAIINVQNYSNSNAYKTILTKGGSAANYTSGGSNVGVYASMNVATWRNTAPVTEITVYASNTSGAGSGANWVTGSTFTLYGIANAAIGAPKATGGIITYDSTYYYHTFGASGTFTPQTNLTNVDYLVIAGGGGGGRYFGGGGGAGGLRSTVDVTGGGGTLESKISLNSGTAYTITVGAGGAGGIDAGSGAQAGVSGGNSSIAGTGLTTITSTGGGGGGGSYGGSNNAGLTGGSGGGGNRDASTAGGSGTANQGYAGSTYTSGTGINAGGGGGGAGETGNTDGNGQGGDGVTIPTIANVTGTGVATYYAGGGAGGGEFVTVGGLGGGGNGGVNSTIASAGAVNTGGGGGGGSQAPSYVGGAGGSGLVVIRYAKA